MLVLQLGQKTITQTRFDAAAADLEMRLQQMWRRLENTYQISSQTDEPYGSGGLTNEKAG